MPGRQGGGDGESRGKNDRSPDGLMLPIIYIIWQGFFLSLEAVLARSFQGRFVWPIRKWSHSRAAPRPSLKAQTTRLWPRRQSPAAKTPLILVEYFSNSAFIFVRGSRSRLR